MNRLHLDVLDDTQKEFIHTLNQPHFLESEPLRIGLLLPTSGPLSSVTKDMQKAANLALFDVSNSHLYLYPHDTAIDAQKAAQKAIKDGIQLFIGPLTGSETRLVQQEVRFKNIPIISFSSTRQLAV